VRTRADPVAGPALALVELGQQLQEPGLGGGDVPGHTQQLGLQITDVHAFQRRAHGQGDNGSGGHDNPRVEPVFDPRMTCGSDSSGLRESERSQASGHSWTSWNSTGGSPVSYGSRSNPRAEPEDQFPNGPVDGYGGGPESASGAPLG
jgi:hypothetical protein